MMILLDDNDKFYVLVHFLWTNDYFQSVNYLILPNFEKLDLFFTSQTVNCSAFLNLFGVNHIAIRMGKFPSVGGK